MRQGSFRAVRHAVFLLVMLSLAVFSTFGDENVQDYRSIMLDSFDEEVAHLEWKYGGKAQNFDFTWAVEGSKFRTENDVDRFPKMTRVEAWPQAVYGANRNNDPLRSFGIWGRFDRRGYNWVDIYPVVPDTEGNGEGPQAFEIPIPGRLNYLDMWVWGSNLNYYLEAYFRDHTGVVHSLHLGDLAFTGWKNMRVRVPNNIAQAKRILPHLAGLHFVKFRIWTTPLERVDNFYVYFDDMKVWTDTFESLFDGNDLADPDRVQELWAQNQGGQE